MPSGVQYGRLIEPFRVAMENPATHNAVESSTHQDWFTKYILLGLMPYPSRLRKALLPARLAQRLGLMWLADKTGLLKLLPARLRQLAQTLPPATKQLPNFLQLFPQLVGDVREWPCSLAVSTM